MAEGVNWSAIRNEYEGGSSLRTLAAKYGVSKSAIAKHKHKEQWTEGAKKGGQVDRKQWTVESVDVEANAIPTPKKDLSTKDLQRLFLESYALHANVMVSARAAGIHRSTVYDWLERDEDFSFAYNQAKEDARDVLRAEIYRRAVEGWEEPVYQLAQFAGTVRKYDTTLLIFHSKMLMPEYRDKSQVDVNAQINGNVQSHQTLAIDPRSLTSEQLATLKSLAMELKAGEKK